MCIQIVTFCNRRYKWARNLACMRECACVSNQVVHVSNQVVMLLHVHTRKRTFHKACAVSKQVVVLLQVHNRKRTFQKVRIIAAVDELWILRPLFELCVIAFWQTRAFSPWHPLLWLCLTILTPWVGSFGL